MVCFPRLNAILFPLPLPAITAPQFNADAGLLGFRERHKWNL
jgi:hypothetical protein